MALTSATSKLPSLLSQVTRCQVAFSRELNANRAVVTKIHRDTFVRKYPTMLVLPDGATINVKYHLPRKIIKLPIDVENCSMADLKRVRNIRRQRGEVKEDTAVEGTAFDPMKYVN